ncbi:hypothetical protein GALMADRAFT_282736 [Galerina marginata CBS 339.88]|uniref:Uncharacterized protein n=1 Tax=Galerina marginata (strain CBS 339.88) TaxID=685588 RepID=A0A067SR84_GALM3|nr:hypothetical protein GALMADRAFT_282736 [Galerina marginata CBS 339.88]
MVGDEDKEIEYNSRLSRAVILPASVGPPCSLPTAAALRAATPVPRVGHRQPRRRRLEQQQQCNRDGDGGVDHPAGPDPAVDIEAQWVKMSAEEVSVHEQLEVLQQKDWKELSLDEKKAAHYVAFGPHVPLCGASTEDLTKEWQEASNERALEMKLNPITGISSEGYKGKGFVQ